MFEVAPTVLFTVPRYLQKFASHVLVGVLNSSRLKRAAYEFRDAFRPQLCPAAMGRPARNGSGPRSTALCAPACSGRSSTSSASTGWSSWSAAAPRCRPRPWRSGTCMGSMSSRCTARPRKPAASSPASADRSRARAMSAPPVEGWEVKLADDGEMLVRGPDLFEGYWATMRRRGGHGADGWLRTGDVGEWRDGALRLIDRARDFLVTSGGKTISPSFIENTLRASPYVAEAVVFGHGRKYLTALIEIDFDTVADWARANDVAYTGFTSLAAAPARERPDQARDRQGQCASSRGSSRSRASASCRRRSIPEEEGEPVTPTRKVKRKLMYERFKALVEEMYDDSEERLLAAGAGDALRAVATRKIRSTMQQREERHAQTDFAAARSPAARCAVPAHRAGRLRDRPDRRADRAAGQHLRARRRGAAHLYRSASTPPAASTARRSS